MARGRTSALRILLAPAAQQTLERWPRSTTMAAGWSRRGQMILRLAAGSSHSAGAQAVGVPRPVVRQGTNRVPAQRVDGLAEAPGCGATGGFAPAVAVHAVRLACERLALRPRSLSQGACHARARPRSAEGIVEELAAATVRRLLAAHPVQPWRPQRWLPPQHPRDAACYATVAGLMARSPRHLRTEKPVRSVDEQTSWPPRPRPSPTLPARPHHLPHRVAPEDKRAGARPLSAAVDTRSGKVYGRWYDRKRPREGRAFLEAVDVEVDEHIRTIHLVCDNGSTPHGKEVRKGLAHHPRVSVHCTPMHCSWMHHVEPWFSIVPRKRLRIGEVESKDPLHTKLDQCISEWHQHAHPFHWSPKAVAKIMAAAPALAA